MKIFCISLMVAFAIIIGFAACSNSNEKKSDEKDSVVTISKAHQMANSEVVVPASYTQIEEVKNDSSIEKQPWSGYYTGTFGKNKLTISLIGIEEDSIYGYSICAGNFTYLKGKMTNNKLWMYENQFATHSGIFEFEIINEMLEGKWTPYDSKKDIAKEFVLNKRDYNYNINAGKYAFVSQRELNREDVENLLPEELRIMVNEIYARYGYCFYKKDMRYYFESQPWYMPITTYVGENVTELEWKNIDLITQYSSYYDKTADDFGR